MFFWNKFCGLLLFLSITALYSTAQKPAFGGLPGFHIGNVSKIPASSIQLLSLPPITASLQNVKQMVPANFYTCNIGFFCKKELLIEKATKIPFRFRLGSLQQCNYYEGKKP